MVKDQPVDGLHGQGGRCAAWSQRRRLPALGQRCLWQPRAACHSAASVSIHPPRVLPAEKRHAKETCAKKQQTRVVLAEQMQAARQRKAALVAAKQQEHQRVEQELAQWEQQVQENKASQKAQIVKLKVRRQGLQWWGLGMAA